MKTILFLVIAVLMAVTSQAQTFDLKVAVDLQSTNNIRAVRVLWGTTSRVYPSGMLFSNVTTLAVTNIITGFQPQTTYYFAATAIDRFGQESALSVETSFGTGTPPPPAAPGFRVLTQTLQASSSILGTFTNVVSTATVIPISDTLIYREFLSWGPPFVMRSQ